MAAYQVEIKRPASKDLAELHPSLGQRLLSAIERLADDPRPRQSRKLATSHNAYRLRVGAYRVLYQVNDQVKTVTIYAVGHRRDVYR